MDIEQAKSICRALGAKGIYRFEMGDDTPRFEARCPETVALGSQNTPLLNLCFADAPEGSGFILVWCEDPASGESDRDVATRCHTAEDLIVRWMEIRKANRATLLDTGLTLGCV